MSLDPDFATIAFQIINFLILTALLYRFLFQPVMRTIKARAAEQDRLVHETARDRKEAAALRADLERRLARAGEEADAIVTAAQEEAEETRRTILRETESEVERILAETHNEARRLHRQALEDLQSQTLDAILDISAQLIGRTSPPELHDALVQQLTDRIWEMGRSEMQRVEEFRRSLGDRAPTARVRTARVLSPEQQGQLARTFTALADRHVNLELITDPAMASGLRVRLGDMIVDHSIAGQLEQLRAETTEALKGQIN